MRPVILPALVVLSIGSAGAVDPAHRALTFEDRVRAQEAIERVYYGHQIGATKTFEQAVPRTMLENKVRKYLEETAALQAYWKTAVTDEMLQRELARVAAGTRMPERLNELYAALGNDPFLVKECLARSTLVDRLTHDFYAFDPTLHVEAKRRAEGLLDQLARHALSANTAHPNRSIFEVVLTGTSAVSPRALDATRPFRQELTPEAFRKQRAQWPAARGQLSSLREERDAFVFGVVLSETPRAVRAARYVVPKIGWDDWWASAKKTLPVDLSPTVATSTGAIPQPPIPSSSPCVADDTWQNGILDDETEQNSSQPAIWTGTEMILWGGWSASDPVGTGVRYDPATDTVTRTSTLGAPHGRSGHTAVWTGTRMLVWGGGDNDGGRYDPAADSWSPISLSGAPSARTAHTAVWTGSEMVVWGGYDAEFVSTNTGGRYDPAADRWSATSTVGAPSPRIGYTAIWAGNSMVVWGGDDGSHFVSTGGKYDPVSDSWKATATAGAPIGRRFHSAIWTGNRMVMWGGQGCSGLGGCDTGARYDPVADTWTATSMVNAPFRRYDHSAIWTGSAMIVWGGYHYGGQYVPFNTGGRYDPVADTWTATSTTGAPSARSQHRAVWTGTLMLITGGTSDYIPGGRYDPATDGWTPLSLVSRQAPAPRFSHSAVWTGTQMVVWGGYDNLVGTVNTGGRYDAATDSWTSTSIVGAPSRRYLHTALWSGDRMLVWGGGGSSSEVGGRYDPVSDTWQAMSVAGVPASRYYHTGVWTGSAMLVWGGLSGNGDGNQLNTGGKYDPASDTWTPTSTIGAPSGRYWHTAVWTGSSMVIWGGGISLIGDGGRYDPVSNTWLPVSANGPQSRYLHYAVWTGARMVVWGGYNGSYPQHNGGRYDPISDSWDGMSTVNAPTVGTDGSAIWTGHLMVVWGGGSGNSFFNTGGRYDPASDIWSATSTIDAPSPRYEHTAVWTGSAMMVWGGSGDGYVPRNTGGSYFVGGPADHDGDGFACDTDCDDTDPAVYPGAPPLCDGKNDNCSDPSWPALPANEANADGDAFRICQGDCDDTRATVYPGAPPLCDGHVNDCADPAWPSQPPNEVDEDRDGYRLCDGDCDDVDPHTHPGGADVCNWRDDDCDGTIDGPSCDAACDPNGKLGREAQLTNSIVADKYQGASGQSAAWNGSAFGFVWDSGYGYRQHFEALDRFGRRTAGPIIFGGAESNARGETSIVWNGTDFAVAWMPNWSTIVLSRLHTDGSSAAPDSIIRSQPEPWIGSPSLVWTGTQYGVAWRDDGYTQGTLFQRVNAGGQPIGDAVVLSSDPGDIVSLVWTDSRFAVAWKDHRDGNNEIYLALIDGDGQQTGGDIRVTTDSADSSLPYLTWTGTNLGLTWVDTRDGNIEIYFERLHADGSPLGGAQRITFNAAGSSQPHVNWTGTEYRIVWTDGRSGHSEIMGIRLDANGSPLGPEAVLTTDLSVSYSPISVWNGNVSGVFFGRALVPRPEIFFTRWASTCADGDGDGVAVSEDCDDGHAAVYPGATEICDGLADDCRVDSWPQLPANEADADGDGVSACAGDCADANPAVHPGAPELCNSQDDNCNAQIDEGLGRPIYLDSDGDGYGSPSATQFTCLSPAGWVLGAGDCDDANSGVHPGAAEVCDAIDDDCNGLIDEDALGVDTDADSIHNACDNCRTIYNADQIDSDGDHVGNSCDNCLFVANVAQVDTDGDGRGNACDNCALSYNPSQNDFDADHAGDACDNCVFDYNPSQSDSNHDGEGDYCDLNDGLIYIYASDRNYREWQQESGYSQWRSYRGSLAVLRATGQYTQALGGNPLAARDCGLSDPFVFDLLVPAPGEVAFNLVTGVAGGMESALGTNSAGAPRVNLNPCP